MEFFVDTVARYQADIILFPELFNAPLIADLDLDLLNELRDQGSGGNMRNRRLDLYNLFWAGQYSIFDFQFAIFDF